MPFKKLEGHTSLFSSKFVSPAQFALAQEIIEANGATIVTRKNLKSFHLQLRGKLASPYFIAKNTALKVKGQVGQYDLSRLKIDAKLAKAQMIEATETPAPTEPTGTGAAAKSKSKKEKTLRLTSRAKSPKKRIAAPAPVTTADAEAEQVISESAADVPETLPEMI